MRVQALETFLFHPDGMTENQAIEGEVYELPEAIGRSLVSAGLVCEVALADAPEKPHAPAPATATTLPNKMAPAPARKGRRAPARAVLVPPPGGGSGGGS